MQTENIYDVQNCYKLNMLRTFLTILLIKCSVGFYQMAKIAVTPTIVLAEFILFRKTISCNKARSNDFVPLLWCHLLVNYCK